MNICINGPNSGAIQMEYKMPIKIERKKFDLLVEKSLSEVVSRELQSMKLCSKIYKKKLFSFSTKNDNYPLSDA